MIQRVQSIYLILAFICMALLLYFPLFSVTATYNSISVTGLFDTHGFSMPEPPTVDADGMSFQKSKSIDFPIYGMVISMALFSIASLLMYKNRKRQLLFCRLNFILHILFVIAFYTLFYLGQTFLTDAMVAQGTEDVVVKFTMEMGFFLLIPTVPFLFLAIRGIKNDMKLLQSIDRIR